MSHVHKIKKKECTEIKTKANKGLYSGRSFYCFCIKSKHDNDMSVMKFNIHKCIGQTEIEFFSE